MNKVKSQYNLLLSVCKNCEYNEDGFCVVELLPCDDIKFKNNHCDNFLDKNTNWYEFYEKLHQEKY